MAVSRVGEGASQATGADEAHEAHEAHAAQAAQATQQAEALQQATAELAEKLQAAPTEAETQQAWEAFTKDAGAIGLQGLVQYKAEGGTGKIKKEDLKIGVKDTNLLGGKLDTLEYKSEQAPGGRKREELKLQSKDEFGAYSKTDTVEVKTGPKSDRSKWDKPSEKIEGGKLKSAREYKFTDKDEVSVKREHALELKEPADKELTKKLEARAKRLQEGGDVLANVFGLKKEVKDKSEATAEAALAKFKSTSADGSTESEGFVGARAKATAEGKVSIGADGLKAEGKLDARAGLYAEVKGKKKGEYGTVEGSASAKAEAYATATGSAKLDVNGLEVKAKAEVGVEVSASVNGKYTTPPVKIGGQDVTAGVEANGRAALEAKAYAEGTVAITRDPPKAIIEGKAGASAVAKLEGDVKVNAGPFAVKASGYVSAGAEAQATASLGYDDGKLKFSFGAGAALGLGAGGKVEMEVDLKAIKDIAVGVATEALDQNGDGKLGLDDAKAVGKAAVTAVADTASKAVDVVADAAHDAVDSAKDTLKAGAKWIGGLFD